MEEKIKELPEIKPVRKVTEKEKKKRETLLNKKFLQDLEKRNQIFDLKIGKKFKFAHAGTAQLIEKIGDSEVWQGAKPVLKNEDEELGSYIVMQLSASRYVFLDNVTPEDWLPTNSTKGIGKMLEVVKYSEDDYRVRGKIKGKNFYTKKPVYKKELVENEVENPDTGEVEIIETEELVLGEDGEPEIDYYEEVVWREPKAVTQTGREAIRIGNAYKLRMQRKRALKESFLMKHMMPILLLIFTVLICGTYYITTKMQVEAMSEEWGELREERGKGVLSPETFAKAVVKQQEKVEANANAPPR